MGWKLGVKGNTYNAQWNPLVKRGGSVCVATTLLLPVGSILRLRRIAITTATLLLPTLIVQAVLEQKRTLSASGACRADGTDIIVNRAVVLRQQAPVDPRERFLVE